MPGETSLGIVYPCEGETIDPAAFAEYANTTQQALAATDAIVLQATRPPAAQVTRLTTIQTIAAGVSTPVSWEAENYDTGGMFTLASPTILTIQSPGTYLVSNWLLELTNPATGTSLRQAILLNGSERAFNKSDALAVGLGYSSAQWSSALLISLAVGNQISVNILYTGTGTMGIFDLVCLTKLSST